MKTGSVFWIRLMGWEINPPAILKTTALLPVKPHHTVLTQTRKVNGED